jgi:hypothetical protein
MRMAVLASCMPRRCPARAPKHACVRDQLTTRLKDLRWETRSTAAHYQVDT